MKILALDTAMAACSAAVLDMADGMLLGAERKEMERGHAEAIGPMVEGVMAQGQLSFDKLDRIAVTTGPGTFTGVRIGLAMARGLGLALNIPVIGIDTLSAIAANLPDDNLPMLILADARNREVYGALFDPDKTCVHKPAVMTLAEAVRLAPPGSLIAGTAASAAMAAGDRPDLKRSSGGDLPDAAKFAYMAANLVPQCAPPEPLYLRAPDAKPQVQNLRPAPTFEIHTVGPEASGLLSQLHAACFEDPWSASAFADLINMPGALALVASDGGVPAGMLLLRQAADEAEVITIGTLPDCRRRGIAGQLLDHAFKHLSLAGARHVFIEVAQSNQDARTLYGKLGFEEAGRRQKYYLRRSGVREDAIILKKALMA